MSESQELADLRQENSALRARLAALEQMPAADDDLRIFPLDDVTSRAFDAVVVVDVDQHISGIDAGAEHVFGYTFDELRGKPLDMLIPIRFRQIHQKHVEQFWLSNEVARPMGGGLRIVSGRRKDGGEFPAEATIVKARGRNLAAMAVFIRDISERKRAEQEAQRLLGQTLLLNRVIAAAASNLEPIAVLNVICSELAHAFGLPQAACALLAPDQTHLTVVAEYRFGGRPSALGAVIPVVGNPATQQVIEQRQPLMLLNAQTDERQSVIHDLEKRRGTISLLIIPLIVHDRVIGTFGLDSLEEREFTADEIALAQSVASAASSVLENAQLYTAAQQELAERRRAEESLARHVAALEALYETALGINSQLDLPVLLQAIVQRAASLLNAHMGGLYLMRADGEALELVVSYNMPDDYTGTILRIGEGVSGRIAQTGLPLMVEDHREWQGQAAIYANHPFRRVLGVPLKIADRVIGVLNIADDQQVGLFSEQEARLATMFADQAAIAVQNARLYGAMQQELAERRRTEEMLKRYNQRLQGMQAIDRALMRSHDQDEPVVITALRYMAQMVPCVEMAIVTFDWATNLATVLARLVGGVVETKSDYSIPLDQIRLGELRRGTLVRQKLQPDTLETVTDHLAYERGIRSFVSVPLKVDDQLLGLLGLLSDTPHFFSDEYIEIAEEVADQISLSLYQERLNEEIRSHAEKLEQRVVERTSEIRQLASLQRAILEHVGMSIISTTPNGAIQSFNPAAERMLGYAANEVVGKATPLLIHSQEEVEQRALEFSADLGITVQPGFDVFVVRCLLGLSNTYEWTYVRKDGSHFPVLLTVSTLHDQDGQIAGYVGVATDITERKAVESALQNLTRRLELATRASRIGIWDWDVRENSLVWDDRMYEIYGITPDQFKRGRDAWKNSLHPDDRARMDELTQAVLRGECTYDAEFRIVRPDGVIRHVEANALVLHDAQNTPARLIGVNWDITERKQAQEALTRYAYEVADLYDNAPCGYHSLNADGVITRINGTELRWLGYTRTEVIGSSFADLIEPHSRQLFHSYHQSLKRHGWVKDIECEVTRKDGTALPVLLSSSAVRGADGEFLECRATMFDINERRAADLKLRASEAAMRRANVEMMHALRLKDEFLANMSHELRTPLNAVLSLAETLAEGIYGAIGDRQRDALHHIVESGHHLLGLINDILDLTKVEAGKLELQFEPLDVESLCTASLRLVTQQAHEKHLRVTFSIESEVREILADERRLKQIVVNLLSNAVKFTPEGGEIGLEVAGDASQGVLRITIWDTGIGIPASKLERIFQPFVQLDSTLARKYSGTGLGLALVQRLTDLHGGRVDVDSEEGRGSRFVVSLPWRVWDGWSLDDDARPVQPQPIPSDQPDASNSNARLILVAEDNRLNMMSFRDYLNASGFRVIEASDGIEAVERAQSSNPDLIIMDIQMPRVDGLEAIRQIRSLPALIKTPIIAVTALAMPGDRERCLAAGADECLSKPVNLKHLLQTIGKLLSHADSITAH